MKYTAKLKKHSTLLAIFLVISMAASGCAQVSGTADGDGTEVRSGATAEDESDVSAAAGEEASGEEQETAPEFTGTGAAALSVSDEAAWYEAKAESESAAEASRAAENEAEESRAAESGAEESRAAESTEEAGRAAESAAAAGKAAAEAGGYDPTVRRDISVDLDAIEEIDNTSEDYGFVNKDRDDLNRPNGIYYYDSKYKQYGGLTHIDTEDKVIYLTMDEGYEYGCTPEILDTLKEKGVHAVFFITKQFYDEDPDLVQRMIDEGHIVGNHTCAHPSGGMPQLGAEAEYEDIKKLNDLVYDKFGYQMKLFRFPEGVASKQSVALLQAMGYTSVFWSFAYKDYDTDDQMDPDEALEKCLDYIHPGAIYLLHAVSTTNTEILGDFIDGARELGYEFGTFPTE